MDSATNQAHIQGFELVHPNICPIYELKGACPAELKLQDLQDIGKQQDIPEESW